MKPSRELARRETETTALDKPIDSPAAPHSYNYGVDPNAESEIHLLDYWRAVRKRLWLVIGIVMLVTMLAAYVPARRASRIEPTQALRYE